jgi:hypothetical protein
MWGSSNLKSKKQFIMKTKSLIASAFALFVVASVSAKDLNPPYCASIPDQTNGWNETKSVATLTGIPANVAKIWCAYALDGSWASWADVAATWTPGSTSIVTARVVPSGSYWKASTSEYPAGAASYTKPGFVAFCLWSPTNTDAKNQDCTAQIAPSNYDCSGSTCILKKASYCDNFRACVSKDGRALQLSGLKNFSPGNWFAYTDDGWASYSDITALVGGTLDQVCVDMSKATYASGPKSGASVDLPLSGSLSMIADASGPGKCTADNKGGNNKNGIDVPNAPVCESCTSNSVDKVAVSTITISPNPASATETIKIGGVYDQKATVSVLSISGQFVGSLVPTVSADAITVSLAGANVSTGIYFVQIQSEGKTFVGKLSVK